MPELPEVEVTRRSFAERIAGAQVLSVRLGAPLRWPLGCQPAFLVGRTVGLAARRGKYLWLPLAHDEPARADAAGGLLMHLGMSGSLAFTESPVPAPAAKHDHFDLVTTRGVLRLTDPRRFGAVVWSPALDAAPAATLLSRLGAEPFDAALTPARFHAALQARRTAVKTALLAGDIVVGAGNIYACEALFAAGIDPRTRCNRLSRPRASACWPACARRWRARSRSADRRCATFAMHMAPMAHTSSRRASMAVRANPAQHCGDHAAARSCRLSARRSSARRCQKR